MQADPDNRCAMWHDLYVMADRAVKTMVWLGGAREDELYDHYIACVDFMNELSARRGAVQRS